MTPEEAVAYWAQRALEAERKLDEFAGKRAAQARKRRIAIEAFHDLTRDRSRAPAEAVLRIEGAIRRVQLPVAPEIALQNLALWNGYPDTPSGLQSARKWLGDARKELPYGHPASSAQIPTGWST